MHYRNEKLKIEILQDPFDDDSLSIVIQNYGSWEIFTIKKRQSVYELFNRACEASRFSQQMPYDDEGVN